MLRLLKYDLKNIFKMWWIAAVALAGTTALGAISLYNIDTFGLSGSGDLSFLSDFSSLIGVWLWLVSVFAFIILSFILICLRYYKNFFSDEGYLTFTLPVKRTQLFGSKLIASFITVTASLLLVTVSISTVVAVGMWISSSGNPLDVLRFFGELFTSSWEHYELGSSTAASVVLSIFTLVVILAAVLAEILLMLFCMTVGGVVAKRGKFIVGLAIFYGAQSLFYYVTMIFMIMVTPVIEGKFTTLSGYHISCAIYLFILLIFFSVISAVCYFCSTYLLKEKLNLP